MYSLNRSKAKHGMVAIMVTAVLMVIMSLITLGFARIVQREQRQGLDDQLSTQAFYAAESGVNVAAAGINALTPAKTTCDVSGLGNGIIDAATPEVRFSCVLIDPSPTTLVFNNGSIKADQSKVIPIIANPRPTTLTFRWGDDTPARTNVDNSCSTNVLPTTAVWGAANRIGMLQLDVIPIQDGTITRSALEQQTATVMLYPCGGSAGASQTYASLSARDDTGARRGQVIGARCNGAAPYPCSFSMTGLPTNGTFYARIKSIYSDLNVEINGSGAGGASAFAGAQVVVDSTGRANDVLRRIQVRLPVYKQYDIPESVLQSQDGVCKLYTITGTTVTTLCP